MIGIVIVDDHPSIRDGLGTRIALEPDLEVRGEADDVESALDLIKKVQPDVAVIDVSLKTGNGIELVKLVKTEAPHVRTLVWSMYDESLYAERALRAGAMGYINKENATGVIIDAIRHILAGEVFLSPKMSSRLVNRIAIGKEVAGTSPVESLSDQELETFSLIGRGMNTSEIAERMKLSPKTVATYRARIKEKLDLNDMASLTREATQWVLEGS